MRGQSVVMAVSCHALPLCLRQEMIKVLNRKSGQMEERQHIYVRTGIYRNAEQVRAEVRSASRTAAAGMVTNTDAKLFF